MTTFTTKYNYLVLVGRIVFTLFFSSIAIFMISIISKEITEIGFSKEVITAVIFFLIMAYLAYHFFSGIVRQPYKLVVEKDSISLSSFFKNVQKYRIDEVKGFSVSDYPTRIWKFKSIILYLKDAKKVELPQFLYLNHNEIEPQLKEVNVKKLGYEKYKWKFFDKRYYEYE